MNKNVGLTCIEEDGGIVIMCGENILACVAHNHPDFWDGEFSDLEACIKVTDMSTFIKEVVREINHEAEDGSTLLTHMIERAMAHAADNGCEGVEYND